MVSGQTWSVGPAADEEVASLGRGHDPKALAPGGSDHDDLVDCGMGAQRMGGPDRGVPGHEHTDYHDGKIGLQAESGSTGSPPRLTHQQEGDDGAEDEEGGETFHKPSLRWIRRQQSTAIERREETWSMARSDLQIDHVIVCVPDLDRAAESFLNGMA